MASPASVFITVRRFMPDARLGARAAHHVNDVSLALLLSFLVADSIAPRARHCHRYRSAISMPFVVNNDSSTARYFDYCLLLRGASAANLAAKERAGTCR